MTPELVVIISLIMALTSVVVALVLVFTKHLTKMSIFALATLMMTTGVLGLIAWGRMTGDTNFGFILISKVFEVDMSSMFVTMSYYLYTVATFHDFSKDRK